MAALGSPHLFDLQAARGQGLQQLRFRPRQLEPGHPIRPFQHDHLPVMDRGDVRPRRRREQRKGLGHIARRWTPKPGEAEPVLARLGKPPLAFRRFRPAKLEEVGCGTRQRPFEKRRPSERKLITGPALGRPGAKPQRSCTSSTPPSAKRRTGAVSVGQMSSRGSRFGIATGTFSGRRVWLNAST